MVAYNFDSSGKVKLPPEAEIKELDVDTAILAYTSGKTEDGRPYYAYIAVQPSKYREFYTKSAARQTLVLNDYGTIVAGDFLAEPPPEVVKEMYDTYGFDDEYEKKLQEEVTKQRSESGDKIEEQRLLDIVSMLKAKKPNGSK